MASCDRYCALIQGNLTRLERKAALHHTLLQYAGRLTIRLLIFLSFSLPLFVSLDLLVSASCLRKGLRVNEKRGENAKTIREKGQRKKIEKQVWGIIRKKQSRKVRQRYTAGHFVLFLSSPPYSFSLPNEVIFLPLLLFSLVLQINKLWQQENLKEKVLQNLLEKEKHYVDSFVFISSTLKCTFIFIIWSAQPHEVCRK